MVTVTLVLVVRRAKVSPEMTTLAQAQSSLEMSKSSHLVEDPLLNLQSQQLFHSLVSLLVDSFPLSLPPLLISGRDEWMDIRVGERATSPDA